MIAERRRDRQNDDGRADELKRSSAESVLS
jgi:hypothetical protein